MADPLARLEVLERAIVQYDVPPAPDQSGLAVLTGSRPVLISAPHAARHWRAGRWKREDEYTAALAHYLHDWLGVHALYITHRINPDPHDDADAGNYKARVAALIQQHDIQLVLDLHGARGDRDFALALGTIYGQTCPPYEAQIVAALTAAGFSPNGGPSLDRLALNPARYAGGSHRETVTRYVWQGLGVPAVQIEINAWVRIVTRLPESWAAQNGDAPHFRGDPGRIRRVLRGLAGIVTEVERPA